jgi:hypothetical protein
MSTKLSAYMGGLGLDARNKLEVESNATITVGGGTSGGNVHIGDTGQIAFGTDKELTILHDGTDSIVGVTSGELNFRGSTVTIESANGTETGVKYVENGAVELYWDNNKHVETKQTGFGITGNVDVSANVGISGNAYVGSYIAIGNTNPAATDALVVNGNIRIQSGQLIFADGSGQSAGSSVTTFPTGDYGLLDAANLASDAFGQVTGGLTQFDMLSQPTGSVDGQDLGALT